MTSEFPLRITRTLTTEECPWLDEPIAEGTVVWSFRGYTYGCITPSGVAVSAVRGEHPFFEVPLDAVIEVAP